MKRFFIRHLDIYFVILASILLASMGILVKFLGSLLPSVEIVFFRNFIGAILILFFILKNPPTQKGGNISLLIFRGVVGVISMIAFFYNIANMGMAEAFTFTKTAPIFVVVICAIFLKEKISFFGWISVFIGFVGILLIVQPNLGFTKTDFTGLISGFFAALAYISMYELKKYYNPKFIVLVFLIIGFIVPLICMILPYFINFPQNLDFIFAKFTMPNSKSLFIIFLMGAIGVIYQICITKAYALSKSASKIAVISNTDVVFSFVFGLAIGDKIPEFIAFLGILMIICSSIIIAKFR